VRRSPNYPVLGAGLAFALISSTALGVFVDLFAAAISFALFLIMGGTLAVLIGDLSMPEDYELPDDTLGDHVRSTHIWPHR